MSTVHPPMPQAVILAFEGVLAPAGILRDTLEPYALDALPDFLERHANTTTVQRVLADIRAYAGRDLDAAALETRIRAWIRSGQDITPVRQLQGLIWADALESGDLRPELPAATGSALVSLADAGVGLYSFGPIPAPVQRAWLRHGPQPQLEDRFAGWFDTRLGGRRDAGSYRRLADEIGTPPETVLYLSPRRDELDAARQAWLQTARPQAAQDGAEDDGHPVRSLTSLITGPAGSR